jgi:glycosyltransferase involved in cell wall biosynthesis
MNIVLINPYLGTVPGGIEQDIVHLASEFARQGDAVTIVTTPYEFPAGRVDPAIPPDYHLDPAVRVVRLEGGFRTRLRGFQPANPPLLLPGLARGVLQSRPDAVVFFNIGWPLTILPALLAIRRHTLVLYQTAYHAPLAPRRLDRWRSRLQLRVAGFSHRLIPHSHHEKQQIMRDGGIPEDKITVVYPGVEVRSLESQEIQAFRARYDLADKVVISHVARLSAFKGTDRLIQVLPEVRGRSGRDVVLLLVGRNLQPEALGRLAGEAKVKAHVRFTGPLSEHDLYLAYAASDVFALPSTYESFGFVFLEAMSQGVPVIGVRTGGVPEVIRDGETGYLLDSQDDQSGLVERLTLLVQNEALRARIGQQAREWAGRFSWAAEATAIKTIIQELQTRAGGHPLRR